MLGVEVGTVEPGQVCELRDALLLVGDLLVAVFQSRLVLLPSFSRLVDHVVVLTHAVEQVVDGGTVGSSLGTLCSGVAGQVGAVTVSHALLLQ